MVNGMLKTKSNNLKTDLFLRTNV